MLPASICAASMLAVLSCAMPAPSSCGTAVSAVKTQARRLCHKPRIVEFVPGVRIDYRAGQVEVDAEVILRHGQLELFAYGRAPVPKEHESILLLEVSPESIFQALGLLGLTPGQPMRYFPATQTLRPPSGDPVDVLVRYQTDSRTVEVSACDWMFDLAANRPMAHTHWLFTGSQRLEDGRFHANIDGTVVTVVDFDSALLALPAAHSESNEHLWLGALTEAIPPVGTKVVLILRRAPRSLRAPADRSPTDRP